MLSQDQEPSFNKIINHKVVEKFIYLLCQNDNCITREIIEDVPPKFYNDNYVPRCRYCRQRYDFKSRKIYSDEIQEFIAGLPTKVLRI